VTFTTLEAFAGGFSCAALALGARGRTAGFFGGPDESLVAAEVLATGLLGATLRLITLGAPAKIFGSFEKTRATLKVGTHCFSCTALALLTLSFAARF
jgi:hypothetical protein